MKVVVLEVSTANHLVMLQNWIRISAVNNLDITIFTNERCLSMLEKTDEYKYGRLSVKKICKFNGDLISEIRSELGPAGRLVVNSIYTNFIFFIFLFATVKHAYFTIHNVNKWFFLTAKSGGIVRRLIRFIILKAIFFLASGVFVNSENMKKYMLSLGVKKRTCVLPFSLKMRPNLKCRNSTFTIVYPGVVSEKRKSYELFFMAAQRFPDIDFILLGTLGKEEINVISRIDKTTCSNVKVFNSYVPVNVFDSYMSKCDLLFSDIKTKFDDEIYGLSKDSGVSYLMYEYCIPLLVNSEFKNTWNLHRVTSYFSNYEELCDYIHFFRGLSSLQWRQKLERIDFARKEISFDVVSKNIAGFIGVSDCGG